MAVGDRRGHVRETSRVTGTIDTDKGMIAFVRRTREK
jgi:hypothetical protein